MEKEFSIISNIDAFLVGMEIENVRSSKKDADLSKAVHSVSTKIDEDMRNVYDRLMPNAHILDSDYTAKLLLRDILVNPQRYFSSVNIEEEGLIYSKSITAEYLDYAKIAASKLITTSVSETIRTKIVTAVKEFHDGLPTTPSKNPLVDLNTLMLEPYTQLQGILTNPDLPEDVKRVQVARLGSIFRSSINKVFGLRTALMSAVVPELGSSNTRLVFFSKSFSGLSTKINDVISKALVSALKASLNVGMVFSVSDTTPVGSTIHFAHTALKNGSESIINTPAYAKMIFTTANTPATSKKSPFSDALRASNHFKLKTGHTKVALSVDKSLLANVGVLMQLGLTFTTDHTAALNLLMSSKESAAGKGHYPSSQAANKATKDLLSQRRVGSMVKALVTENPQFGTSSPSLMGMLTDAIVETISTGKAKTRKYSYKKNKSIVSKYYEPNKPTNVPERVKHVAKKTPKVLPKAPVLRNVQGKFFSLASLLLILNSQLQDVVSANMGGGDSREVLNYRTGRLAESVQVERLSQSRQGMITAFYTYMRNPYATFSTGGQQEHPKSRDPKLLISKSIRDIASQHVTNILRSVNV